VAFPRQLVALAEVAGPAGRDDVLPRRAAAAAAGDDVVEGQFLGRAALGTVLAFEAVAQEDVEAGEGRAARCRDVSLQRDHAGQPHGHAGRVDLGLVFRQDRDPVEEHGLHRILPRPDRQGKIGQRPEVRVQDERGEGLSYDEVSAIRQAPLP